MQHEAESAEPPHDGGIQSPPAGGGAEPGYPEVAAYPPWVPPPKVAMWRRRGPRLAVVCALFAVCGVIMLLMVHKQTGTQGLIVGAILATLPSPLLVLAFRWIDRVDPRPWGNVAFAFAWGACAATLVAIIANSFAAEWIASGMPVGRAREADLWTASLVAPVVEESAKAGALLLLFLFRRRHFTGLVDGIVVAGLAATGFAFTENILYLGSAFGEDQNPGYDSGVSVTVVTFVMRGIFSPFAHPLFTAMTGIGFALAARAARGKKARRILLPIAGLLAAMVMHGMWNGSLVFGGAGFLGVYTLFMMPVFGLLIWLAISARGAELGVLRDTLPGYATAGWLTVPEPYALASFRARKLARDLVTRTHGKPARKAVAEYVTAATRLARLRSRADRGDLGPDFPLREGELLHVMAQHRVLAQPALTQAAFATFPPRVVMPPMPPPGAWYPPPAPGAQPYVPGPYPPPTPYAPASYIPAVHGPYAPPPPAPYYPPPGGYPPPVPGPYPPPPGVSAPPQGPPPQAPPPQQPTTAWGRTGYGRHT